jgi:hypothetical protein
VDGAVDGAVDKDIHSSMTVSEPPPDRSRVRFGGLQCIDYYGVFGVIPESPALHNHSNNPI